MKYLITGGTGLIGRHLIKMLVEEGHEVYNLSRSKKDSEFDALQHHEWDGIKVPETVPESNVVINLAGAGIADKRWSEAYKKVIYDSRIHATQACVEYISRQKTKPKVFISASGFNYYGTLVDQPVDESSPAGKGFMPKICADWEAAAQTADCRTVFLRTSVVFDAKVGALPKMLSPYKMFVGGPTGTGKQGFPWIHIQDMVRAIRFVEQIEGISGPVNMCSPHPISMNEFSKTLGKVLGRPSFFRLGKGILNIIFGELATILWGGAFVNPEVLKSHDFHWDFPDLEPALRNLLGR